MVITELHIENIKGLQNFELKLFNLIVLIF